MSKEERKGRNQGKKEREEGRTYAQNRGRAL